MQKCILTQEKLKDISQNIYLIEEDYLYDEDDNAREKFVSTIYNYIESYIADIKNNDLEITDKNIDQITNAIMNGLQIVEDDDIINFDNFKSKLIAANQGLVRNEANDSISTENVLKEIGNLKNESIMNRQVFILEETIGKLRQLERYEEDVDFSAIRISAIPTYIRNWDHYGSHTIYRLDIFQNGEKKPIEINNWLFDSSIIYEDHYTKNTNSSRMTITINGQTSEGKIFELKLGITGSEILAYVIYAMVMLSSMESYDTTAEYWEIMCGYKAMPLEKRIAIAKDINFKSKTIISKYPFMKKFFQEGLTCLVTIIKNEFVGQIDSLANV